MQYFISLIFFSISLFGFNYHLKPYNIIDGVYCFFGLPSEVNYINGGNMINSCYIETEEGYVVIDSGPTYYYAKNAYRVMESIKKLPIKYVINTSLSEVHLLGNQFYKKHGAILLGPKDYKKIEKRKNLNLSTYLPEDILLKSKIVPLSQYLNDDKVINVGGIKFDINHIDGDNKHLYVYIKSKKIVFAGDMIFNNRLPALKNNRSLLVWEKGLENLVKLDWSDIVSAHGYMTRRSAVKNTKSYLTLLKQEVQDSIKRGYSKKETLKRVKLLEFSDDRLYAKWHNLNVETVYNELKIKKRVSKKNISIKPLLKREKSEKTKNKKNVKKKVFKKIKEVITKNPSKRKRRYSLDYVSFASAIKRAKKNHKIIFIKVRSTTCKYCDQLDKVLKNNQKIIQRITQYFEIVEINSDYDAIPLDLTVRSTPTLIFIRPDNQKVLMQLPGIRVLGELSDILNEAITDGHNGGYLKP